MNKRILSLLLICLLASVSVWGMAEVAFANVTMHWTATADEIVADSQTTLSLHDFDYDIYKATKMLETIPTGMINSYATMESEPMRLCNELYQNAEFRAKVLAWEVLTITGEDIPEDASRPVVYYETVLFDMLNSLSFSDSHFDAISDTNNLNILKILESCTELLQYDYGIDLGLLHTDDNALETLQEWIDAARASSAQVFDNENDNPLLSMLKEYRQTFAMADLIEDVSTGLSACSSLYDSIKATASCMTLIDTAGDMHDVVDELYEQTAFLDNQALKTALYEMKVFTDDDQFKTTALNVFRNGVLQFANEGYKAVVGPLWKDVITSVGGSFAAGALIGQAIGESFSNWFFSTDKIIEQYYKLKSYRDIYNLTVSCMERLKNEFASNQSKENAQKYLASVKLFFNLNVVGYEFAKEYARILFTDGIWAKLSYNDNYNKLNDYIEKCDQIEQDFKVAQQSLEFYWINSLADDYPTLYAVMQGIAQEEGHPTILVKQIDITSPDVMEIYLGDYFVLVEASVFPANATNKNIVFTSSDESVLTIDNQGFVTPHNLGEAIVTAISQDGGYQDQITIIVKDRDPAQIEFSTEDSSDFTYTVTDGKVTITKYNGSAVYVTIPEKIDGYPVVAIGQYAFYSKGSLKTIDFSKASYLNSISSYAFQECGRLQNINFGNSITVISSYAFYGCNNISSIELPESLITIGSNVFTSPLITSISIPNRIETDRNNLSSPFYKCKNLKTVYFESGQSTIPSQIIKACLSVDTIVLPYGVVSIGKDAFSETGIKEIQLPGSLETISTYAFGNCDNLEKIEITENVKEISNSAFANCDNLKEVKLNEGLETIKSSAFNNCNNLREFNIPESLITIEDEVISSPYITTIEIPSNIQTFGNSRGSFSLCPNLERVVFSPGRTVIPDKALIKSKSVNEIILPMGLEEIGTEAFNGCDNLRELNLPETVKTLGSRIISSTYITTVSIPHSVDNFPNAYGANPFYNSKNLEKIIFLPGRTKIPVSALHDCTSLKEVFLPDGLLEIGDEAFKGCNNLESFNIPESVTTLGVRIISSPNITSLTIPGSVEVFRSSGGTAFSSCPNLETVTFLPGRTAIPQNALYQCKSIKHIYLPDGCIDIGSGAFFATDIEEIVLPGTVKTIQGSAFSGCSSLKNVVFGEGLETIESYAFYKCTSLDHLEFPDGLKTINDGAFNGCDSVSSVNLPDSLEKLGKTVFTSPGIKEVVIPSNITVMNSSFSDCPELQRVDFSSGMTVIPYDALKYCESVVHVTIPEGIVNIESNAFCSTSIEKLVLPDSLTDIGYCAFEKCLELSEIKFGGQLRKIDVEAFNGCVSLTDVQLPDTVQEIGYKAFWDCELKDIRLPEGLIDIGYQAVNSAKITRLEIPANITRFGYNAGKGPFGYCSNLQQVEFVSGRVTIEDFTLSGCESLKKVVIPSSIITIEDTAFSGCSGYSIYGYHNSYAQEYAEENDIPFVAIPGSDISYTPIDDITSCFKDEAFRTCVRERLEIDEEEPITISACDNVWRLDVSNSNINDLSGIEYFVELRELNCYGNNLTELDVSNNLNLHELYCSSNLLTALDISKNIKISTLSCEDNKIKDLNIENVRDISLLDCSNNKIEELNLKSAENLIYLRCDDNKLKNIDVKYNTKLMEIECNNNEMEYLDVSNNCELTELECAYNYLEQLDVSANTQLDELRCHGNRLLDLTLNTGIKEIHCDNNRLTKLNVSGFPNLEVLNCSNNYLTSLDVTNDSELYDLDVSDNYIPSMDKVIREGSISRVNYLFQKELPAADFIMSSGLRIIEEEAFKSIGAGFVVIPDRTEAIRSQAFADCSDLCFINIPSSVHEIAVDAIDQNVVIISPKDSYAYQFGVENGYIVMPEEAFESLSMF